MNIKNNKGVTLIVLVITIIVILILAGITINAGTETIKKAQFETLRTNMLLIRAKAKEYCEEANFKVGPVQEPTEEDIKKGTDFLSNDKNLSTPETTPSIIDDTFNFIAELDNETLKSMGLNEVANTNNAGTFYVGFKIKDNKVEVYNSNGYNATDGKTYYKLSEIEKLSE